MGEGGGGGGGGRWRREGGGGRWRREGGGGGGGERKVQIRTGDSFPSLPCPTHLQRPLLVGLPVLLGVSDDHWQPWGFIALDELLLTHLQGRGREGGREKASRMDELPKP